MTMTHKEALYKACMAYDDYDNDPHDAMGTAIRAYIEARGLVLVPKDATDEMRMAYSHNANPKFLQLSDAGYVSMLAAAPDPFMDGSGMKNRAKIDWKNMTDEEFVKNAETHIWFSAFANNNRRAPAHEEADNAYVEAKRRDKPWLYTRAYNAAYVSCGFTLNDDDRERATEAYWVEKNSEESKAGAA